MPGSRVAQISWKRKIRENLSLLLAVEEPRVDYTPLDSAIPLKSAFPELVIKPNYKFKNGHWANSLIYKPFVYTGKNYSFKKKLGGLGFYQRGHL